MSGGVDSAVSLLLLQRSHPSHTIEAVYMSNWDSTTTSSDNTRCPDDDNFASALKSTLHTGRLLNTKYKLHHLRFARDYWSTVFVPTLAAYRSGLTPNPDIWCNRHIKFGALRQWASEHGFDHVVTGHYAQFHQGRLLRGVDGSKDQSYFLAGTPHDALEGVLFPVGALTKNRVKELAREAGLLHVLRRPESMGLCFVNPASAFTDFMSEFEPTPRFQVRGLQSDRLIASDYSGFITIGAAVRVGGLKERLYISKRDGNLLWCAPRSHPSLHMSFLKVTSFNWLVPRDELASLIASLQARDNLSCCIRSTDKIGTPCSVKVSTQNSLEITLDEPVWAPAPGQWAVLYRPMADGLTQCLGGGVIAEAR